MDTPRPAIFVISLARSSRRRATMAAALEKLSLPFSFFDAVDGSQIDLASSPDYNGTLRRLVAGRDLTQGEFGCLLSHRALLEKIAAEKIPRALILEDDAILSPELPAVLDALMRQDWDVVRFLARPKTARESVKVRDIGNGFSMTRVFGTPGGAYGYLVTDRAAARLAEFMQVNWQPNDTLLGQSWRTGLDVFGVLPAPVRADDEIESTIGDERFRKSKESLNGWEKISHPAARAAFKIWENAGKHSAWRAQKRRDRA